MFKLQLASDTQTLLTTHGETPLVAAARLLEIAEPKALGLTPQALQILLAQATAAAEEEDQKITTTGHGYIVHLECLRQNGLDQLGSEKSGKKVYGPTPQNPSLVISNSFVENGAWEVEWLDKTHHTGVCKGHDSQKEHSFHYLGHVPESLRGADYNNILEHARTHAPQN